MCSWYIGNDATSRRGGFHINPLIVSNFNYFDLFPLRFVMGRHQKGWSERACHVFCCPLVFRTDVAPTSLPRVTGICMQQQHICTNGASMHVYRRGETLQIIDSWGILKSTHRFCSHYAMWAFWKSPHSNHNEHHGHIDCKYKSGFGLVIHTAQVRVTDGSITSRGTTRALASQRQRDWTNRCHDGRRSCWTRPGGAFVPGACR